MAKDTIDAEDALVFSVFGLAAAATVGIADVELFSYAFSQEITQIAGASISLASLVSVAAFAWIVATNEVGMDDVQNLDQEYYYIVLATAALIVAIPFVPQVHDFVTSNDVYAVSALAIQATGAVAVGYKA